MSVVAGGLGSEGGLVVSQGLGGLGRFFPLADVCFILSLPDEAAYAIDLSLDAVFVLLLPPDAELELLDYGTLDIVLELPSEAVFVLELPLEASLELNDLNEAAIEVNSDMEPDFTIDLPIEAEIELDDSTALELTLNLPTEASFVLDLEEELCP